MKKMAAILIIRLVLRPEYITKKEMFLTVMMNKVLFIVAQLLFNYHVIANSKYI